MVPFFFCAREARAAEGRRPKAASASRALEKGDHNMGTRNSRRASPVAVNASTKSHASGKIKNRSIRILRIGSDVFFDADSESPT